jgi:hypothetical protein
MSKTIYTVVVVFFAILSPLSNLNAQEVVRRSCHSTECRHQHLMEDATMRQRTEDLEAFTLQFGRGLALRNNDEVTIPVVVHVVYRSEAENITEAQINAQIDALNRDYNKRNTDISALPTEFAGTAAATNISFKLAARTPDNKPTNGILRYQSSRAEWGILDDVKRTTKGGFQNWDPAKYLNIYVCNIGGGTLGYASFPGAPASLDGIVIDFRAFGTGGTARAPYSRGRTLVHEVGHWLNLYHIWGDSDCGDDHCSDTPTQKDANYGNPSTPQYSTCGGKTSRDMSMNFMDYVNDDAMIVFTAAQKVRMWATLNSVRKGILTSNGCEPIAPSQCKVEQVAAKDIKTNTAILTWKEIMGVKTYTVEYKSSNTNWVATPTSQATLTLNNLTAGTTYSIRVKAACDATDYSSEVQFMTQSLTKGSDDYENNNTRSEAKIVNANTTITALIGASDDRDWFVVKSTTALPNVKFDLSNLPTDFDLRVYDANGRLIRLSENRGLMSETAAVNSTVASTYYVQIHGFAGAFDVTNSYKLTTTLSASRFAGGNKVTEVEENNFSVYPNPVVLDTNLRFDILNEGDVNIQISDLKGAIMFQTTRNITKATPSVNLDLANLPSGTYIIAAEKDGSTTSKKLVKM